MLQNRVVKTIEFTIKDEHGNILESTKNNESYNYLQGSDCLPEAIENAIDAHVPGDEFSLTLSPEEAYGYRSEELQKEVLLKDLSVNDKEIKIGDCIDLDNDGNASYDWLVVKVEEDKVCVDANHPWAGERLSITVKIIKQRPAVAAEINKGVVLSEELLAAACCSGKCC